MGKVNGYSKDIDLENIFRNFFMRKEKSIKYFLKLSITKEKC